MFLKVTQVCLPVYIILKGEWQHVVSFEQVYRTILYYRIFSSPPSWIFVDMHDTLGHANLLSYETMINLCP